MKRIALALAALAAAIPYAHAQNRPNCRTGTAGASTSYCASEAFVQSILSGGFGSTESKNLFFAGPNTGSAAAPTFRAIDTADLNALTGTEPDNKFLAGAVSGAVATPTFRFLDVADLAAITSTVTDNTFFAGASTGAAAAPAFRTLATADLNSTAGQYPGTNTNDNASSGNIGQFISSNVPAASEINPASATPADVTNVSLTAGDWDCRGNEVFDPSGAPTAIDAWISSTSATLPTAPNSGAETVLQLTFASALRQFVPVGAIRFSLSGTTTVYLSTACTFPGGTTCKVFGFIGCRRMR
jgi:hypothetical protein